MKLLIFSRSSARFRDLTHQGTLRLLQGYHISCSQNIVCPRAMLSASIDDISIGQQSSRFHPTGSNKRIVHKILNSFPPADTKCNVCNMNTHGPGWILFNAVTWDSISGCLRNAVFLGIGVGLISKDPILSTETVCLQRLPYWVAIRQFYAMQYSLSNLHKPFSRA